VITIVDYGMGNVASIANLLRKIGAEVVISADCETIGKASLLILPGVGSFDEGMRNITRLGLKEVLDSRVLGDEIPTLGICLGMQLMGRRSAEGVLPGLGWIDFDVERFNPRDGSERLKIPHMGWNTIKPVKQSVLLEGLGESSRFYFVHSYHAVCGNSADVLATAHYGDEFTAAFERGNIAGVQFHPEKSHRFGKQLLGNFVRYANLAFRPREAPIPGA
jgi:imidazole glycerol-phosphate synthase subunit HisH